MNSLDTVREPQNTEVDIVAVHGLHPFGSGSNAFSTWTSEAPSKKEAGRNWISDQEFLPALVPTARIMIFSYNSNAVFQAASATVNDHATNLLEMLRLRRKKNPSRPLVFICHSLGGLLVKRALCAAYLSDTYKPTIYSSTKGIVFFATPHGGGQHVSVGNTAVQILGTLTNKPDSKYMEALRSNSLCSEENREDFLQRANDFDFVSFIETRKTKGVTVVKKDDSVLGLPHVKEKKISIDADHTSICRFSDPAGRDWCSVVKDSIGELAENAISAAVEGPNTQTTSPGAPPTVNRITLVPYLENTKFHGRTQQINNIKQFFTTPSLSTGQPTQENRARGQRRLVLQGFAGIGKTTLALQYSVEYRNQYEGVFWISAQQLDSESLEPSSSSTRSASSAVQREMLRLDEEVNSQTDHSSLGDWCAVSPDRKWLLIIDNLEDPLSLRGSKNPSRPLIPTGGCGDVLITTRRTDLNQLGTVMAIPPLPEDEAAALLRMYGENRAPDPLGAEHEDKDALRIARMLGCVPLALRHCGCLVSEQRRRLSSYIKDFDGLMADLVIPEHRRGGDENGGGYFDLNESKPLLGSFELSLRHVVRDHSAEAGNMLALLANLDPTDISEAMLRRSLGPRQKRWDDAGEMVAGGVTAGLAQWLVELPEKDFGRGLNELLNALVRYSLLFRKANEGHFFLHPLMHFWLRWKQDTRRQLGPFKDSTMLLLNGFPHPELSRTYGLAKRHKATRMVYIPHVQHLLKRYRRLRRSLSPHGPDGDADGEIGNTAALKELARLFLHASDAPPEHRPARQRVKQTASLGGVSCTLPTGRLDEPFDPDDSVFLDAVEDIVARLGHPATLYLDAVRIFFEPLCRDWARAHLHSAYSVKDIKFAGRPLVDVRAGLPGAQLVPDSRRPGSDTAGQYHKEIQDLEGLMPVLPDPGSDEDAEVNVELDVQTGLLGLIALKYILHVRISVFENGPRIEVDQRTQSINMIVDNREWIPGYISMQWSMHFASLLDGSEGNDDSTTMGCLISPFTRTVHAEHVLQWYQAKNDTGELAPLWPMIRTHASKAASRLAAILGAESVPAAEALFMIIWDRTSPSTAQAAGILDRTIASALGTGPESITRDNFYFKIKLIDAWQYSLAARGEVKMVEKVVIVWLDWFLAAKRGIDGAGSTDHTDGTGGQPPYYRRGGGDWGNDDPDGQGDVVPGEAWWDFVLDPILDLFEFAIHMYDHWIPPREPGERYEEPSRLAAHFRERYLDYFDSEYGGGNGGLHQRLCLGCGVGVFGMRHARIRIGTAPEAENGTASDDNAVTAKKHTWQTGAPGQQSAGVAFRVALFDQLKEKLGSAGSCLPDDSRVPAGANTNSESARGLRTRGGTSRLKEQQWCHRRYKAFAGALFPKAAVTSGTSFGKTSWSQVFPAEDTVDEVVFRAEEERVKWVTLEAMQEALVMAFGQSLAQEELGGQDGDEDVSSSVNENQPETRATPDTTSQNASSNDIPGRFGIRGLLRDSRESRVPTRLGGLMHKVSTLRR